MMNVNQGTIDIDTPSNKYVHKQVPGSKKKLLVLGTLLCYMCTYVCNTITQHTTCNVQQQNRKTAARQHEV